MTSKSYIKISLIGTVIFFALFFFSFADNLPFANSLYPCSEFGKVFNFQEAINSEFQNQPDQLCDSDIGRNHIFDSYPGVKFLYHISIDYSGKYYEASPSVSSIILPTILWLLLDMFLVAITIKPLKTIKLKQQNRSNLLIVFEITILMAIISVLLIFIAYFFEPVRAILVQGMGDQFGGEGFINLDDAVVIGFGFLFLFLWNSIFASRFALKGQQPVNTTV